jgi:hypothetical protein
VNKYNFHPVNCLIKDGLSCITKSSYPSPVTLKNTIRASYYRWRLLHRRSMLVLGKILLKRKLLSSKIVLSYSPGRKFDGLGAQMQRVLGINALGEYWSLKVEHKPILDVAIHPLDFIETPDKYEVFMQRVNTVIGVDSQREVPENALYFDAFNFRNLLKVIFYVFQLREVVFVQITHPYFFIDASPSLYRCASNAKVAQKLGQFTTMDLSDQIVLHHRQGVGNMAIQPGQKCPREIPAEAYSVVLNERLKAHKNRKVTIYTDAPSSDLDFYPPSQQLESWRDLPAFDGTKMKIAANSLSGLAEKLPMQPTIIRGGDPLDALANLLTSRVLVLSRSSFGYVAAILSESAEVWIPSDFWHPRIPGWHNYLPSLPHRQINDSF